MKLAICVIVVLAAVIGPAGAQVEPPKLQPAPKPKFHAPPSKIKFGLLIECDVQPLQQPGPKTPPTHRFTVTNSLKTNLSGGTTYNIWPEGAAAPVNYRPNYPLAAGESFYLDSGGIAPASCKAYAFRP